jgi:histidine ammonia-lyase
VTVILGTEPTLEDVLAVALDEEPVDIDPGVEPRVVAARRVVEDAASSGRAVYGINTGVGDLANVRIRAEEAARLQRGLIRAHATAVGPPLSRDVVRAMLFLKARTFAFGHSGVRFEIVERLVDLLNHGIHPVVPSQGSLGASGDLAPLAHLALPLIGEGEVERSGVVVPAADALAEAGLDPIEPAPKEGLSLINGTEGMLALGILALRRAERVAEAADVTAAMSVEADLATDAVYAAELISLRKHPGAEVVAANIRSLLRDSPIVASHRHSDHLVQDAYSLRCTPQVHGAYRDGIDYVRNTLQRELASAIDNPSVLPERDAVMSSGNFHGEALGLALDHLGLCLVGFATIAERRIARLVDPKLSNGLPAFLTTDPGRRTGFMIAHYTAASLVAESRSLCFPASSDSIPTSAGQEDHVSMGATSARKALAIADNTENVLAIEALAAAQGLDLRGMEPAPGTGAARASIRRVAPKLEEDRPLAPDIARVRALIANGELASLSG